MSRTVGDHLGLDVREHEGGLVAVNDAATTTTPPSR